MIHDALRDVFCYIPSYGGLRVGAWLASTVPALVRATPVTRAKGKRKTRSDKGTKRGPRKGPSRTPDSGVVLF